METLLKNVLLAVRDAGEMELIGNAIARFSPRIRLEVVRTGGEAKRFLAGEAPFADRPAYSMPSLAFVDADLVDVAGIELLEWIRRHPRLGGMVVIVLVGSHAEEEVKRAYRLKANSVLSKHPLFDIPDICHAVLRYWFDFNQGPILG